MQIKDELKVLAEIWWQNKTEVFIKKAITFNSLSNTNSTWTGFGTDQGCAGGKLLLIVSN
jgi:hypothetical protein